MMDPEVKQAWIAALRSGKYKQARYKLKARNGAMCCLGVLADLQGKEWVWDATDQEYVDFDGTSDVREIQKAGVKPVAARQLAEMNDGAPGIGGKRYSFPEIADWIEKNL